MVLNLRALDRIQEKIQAQMAEDEAKEMAKENEAKKGVATEETAGPADPAPEGRAMKLPADQA